MGEIMHDCPNFPDPCELGSLRDFDAVYDLMVINFHAQEIEVNPISKSYSRSVIQSEGLTADQKVAQLKKNLGRWIGAPRD